MLAMFEKLINEHGSSVILKERLGLFSDKYTLLEEKLESSKHKNSALEAKAQSLKAQLDQATQEIERLEEIINSTTKKECSEKLDEVKKQILKTFFDTNNYFTVTELSRNFGQQESIIRYHIDLLKDGKLINHGPLQINSPATYAITKLGRKYVVEELSK